MLRSSGGRTRLAGTGPAPTDMRVTERENPESRALDTKPARQILEIINREDRRVALAVAKAIPQMARAVDLIVRCLETGGRLVYLGAGTSGRLGVLDAAECLPTFSTDRVIAVMAGAPDAVFRPSEVSEDNRALAVRDLKRVHFQRRDVLVGISASGRTPYVIGGLGYARSLRARTVAVTCNPDAPMKHWADVSISAVVGPEVIAGSTRMKAGTAQKLVLNMLSTASMARWGRVLSNLMVNVQLTNDKLKKRALGILEKTTGAKPAAASRALTRSGNNLPIAMLMLKKKITSDEARELLSCGSNIARVLREAGIKV